jgi:hypothetical protein
MRYRIRQQRRLVSRVAIGMAVAAVLAPVGVANAQTAQPPTLEELQQLRFTPSDEPAGATLVHPFSFVPSDEPAGPTVVTSGLPTVDELQQFRFQPTPVAAPSAEPTADGIDWADAGVGAGVGIAAALLAAAAALGVRRRQRLAHS